MYLYSYISVDIHRYKIYIYMNTSKNSFLLPLIYFEMHTYLNKYVWLGSFHAADRTALSTTILTSIHVYICLLTNFIR